MPADETGDVGTKWHNPQMVGAREIECKSGKLRPQAMAFQGLRDFGVIEDDAIGKPSIGEQRTKSVNEQFETTGTFVVGDGYLVEVYIHWSPCGLAGFFGFLHARLRVTGESIREFSKTKA